MKQLHISIDPGHGSARAPGVMFGTLAEKDANLATALTMKYLLTQLGHRVTMTRSDDRYVDNSVRCVTDADAIIAIHYDSTPGHSLIYYPAAGKSPKEDASLIVADNVALALGIRAVPSTESRFGRLYIDEALTVALLYEVDRLSDYRNDPAYRSYKCGLFLGAFLASMI